MFVRLGMKHLRNARSASLAIGCVLGASGCASSNLCSDFYDPCYYRAGTYVPCGSNGGEPWLLLPAYAVVGGVLLAGVTIQFAFEALDAIAVEIQHAIDRGVGPNTDATAVLDAVGEGLDAAGGVVADVGQGAWWLVTRPIALVFESSEDPVEVPPRAPSGEDPYQIYLRAGPSGDESPR